MTNLRKISINIVIETLAKNKVLNVEWFMNEHKTELLDVIKQAEATEHWSLIQDKVNQLIKVGA